MPTLQPTDAAARGARRRRTVRLAAGGAAVAVLAAAGIALVARDGEDGGGATRPPQADGSTIDVMTAGAVGDGRTDDTKALQAVFDRARPGQTVLLPEGRTFAVGDVLTLSNPRVTVRGGGTLLATDEGRSSLDLAADGITLADVTLSISNTTRRWDAYEQQRLRIDGHTGITVRDVTVTGSAAAGVYVGGGTSNFLLDGVHVSGTRADGIHITQGAHDGKVVDPVVRNVGDDGVAVVSYAQDGAPCADITVQSPVVDGTDARGVSVVGGENITYDDITVSGTAAAGVYVAAEGSYDTAGVSGVTVHGGSVTDANTDTGTDHGAVLVYNGTQVRSVSDVRISDLELKDTRASASRWVGLVADSDKGRIADVTLTDLALDGKGPDEPFVSNQPATTFQASGWTRNGKKISAQRDGQQPTASAGPTASSPATTSGAPSTEPPPTATGAAGSTSATAAGASADDGPGVAASGPAVSVLDLGAAGDGVTDDTAALQAAFDAARPGETVLLPAGRTFVQSAVLTVSSPGITVAGGGTLLATDERESSLTLAADSVTLRDVTLRIQRTTKRWDAYEQQRLRLDGHSGIAVRNVTVQGSAAAGVYVGGSTSRFVLDHVTVTGTRADGVHMTQGAHDGRVVAPVVRNVGDDGVAVVSYAQDGAPCARITIQSPTVDGSSGGRGISVVGGVNIQYYGITVRNTYAAGVYIAAEGGWNTAGVSGVTVQGGSVTGANAGNDIDHGAVLVYDGTSDRAVSNVTVADLAISGTRSSVSRWVGLIADSGGAISGAVLSNLAIDGAGPATPFVSNAPSTGYRLAGWTRDGRALPPQSTQ